MESNAKSDSGRYLLTLTLGALGVVYGDIGTSPLYALRECFAPSHGVALTHESIFGILSLVFWVLTIVVSVKYLLFVMRADNKGEGGVLSLMSLAQPNPAEPRSKKMAQVVVYLGLFGAALMYGDGVLTPAISVLSAVEGVSVVTSAFDAYIVPITAIILVGLFLVQSRGTGVIGKVFGPVILVWFVIIGILGVHGILKAPQVLGAISPVYAISFLFSHGSAVFFVLGGVFLTVTGGEALYADMGHFGCKSIRIGWFALVFPALILNYFGQGGLLISDPSAIENPFYLLAPTWARIPLVVLATLSTVIASQAVISGAFSLTRQAVQLGYLPRVRISHTSCDEIGQIYVGLVNVLLLIGTLWLVFEFRSSTRLASAYGIAVSTTMVITTFLMFVMTQRVWGWKLWQALLATFPLLILDLTLWSANVTKIQDGGWFPLALGMFVFTLMTTWRTGRSILAARLRAGILPLEVFVSGIAETSIVRVPGTAIFLSRSVEGVPPSLRHHVERNKVLHETVVLMMIETRDVPYVEQFDRAQVEGLGHGFYRVIAHYGFMESPSVPEIIGVCKEQGFDFDPDNATYFVGTETIIANDRPGMALWREKLFAFMSRNAERPTEFFKVPRDRVFEIGLQIGI